MGETGRIVEDRREKPKRVDSQDQETEEGQCRQHLSPLPGCAQDMGVALFMKMGNPGEEQ